jgi:hypothetical protein
MSDVTVSIELEQYTLKISDATGSLRLASINPSNVSSTASAGLRRDVSRADHVHAITVATIQSVLAQATAPTHVGNQTLSSVADPTVPSDAATKSYVDAVADARTSAANAHSDAADAVTLLSAQTYADAAAQTALTDAHEYTDAAIEAIPPPTTVTSAAVLTALAGAAANVDVNGQRIVDIAEPVAPQDAATKAYVDANAGGGVGGGALPLTADVELIVNDEGDDDTGNSVLPFASVEGAANWLADECCGNLGGHTAVITDERAATVEDVEIGGFYNGVLELVGATLGICVIRDISDLLFTDVDVEDEVLVTNCAGELHASIGTSGRIVARRCDLKAYLAASGCTGSALRTEFCSYIGYEMAANGCLATPVEHIGTMFSELIGGGLTGSNPSAPRAMFVAGGGKHIVTGASMSSSNAWACDIDGEGVTWASLSYENFENGGTFVYWGDNRWVRMGRLRIYNNSSTPYDDLIVESLQFGQYMKQYGVDRPLDPAYKEITARSGGGQALATVVGRQDTLIVSAAEDGDSVRLLSESDAPVMGGGAKGSVWNRTTKSIDLFPPSGKKIYYGGITFAANEPIDLPPGVSVRWLCDNEGNYNIG